MPRAEYDALSAAVRHLKLLGVSGLLVIVVVFAPLVVLVSQSLLLVGVTLLAVFYFWFGPYYQRRIRRLRRSLPRWELRPADLSEGSASPAEVRGPTGRGPARPRNGANGA